MSQDAAFRPAGVARPIAYALLWRCANALQRASTGCLCLAAGMLREDDLKAASILRWIRYSEAVDDSAAGLTEWERRLYDDVLAPTDRLLLVGCGRGRDLLALIERGHDVTGVDHAPQVVELARSHLSARGLTATVLAGSVGAARLDGQQYDAVIFSSGCYSSVRGAGARAAMLGWTRDHLRPHGRVIIEYTGYVPQSPLAHTLTRLSARLSCTDWKPEAGDVFSRDLATRHVLRYEHRFGAGELAAECAAVGLTVVRDEPTRTPFRYAVAAASA